MSLHEQPTLAGLRPPLKSFAPARVTFGPATESPVSRIVHRDDARRSEMRVLVAYASKRGGTQGIAEDIGKAFADRGVEADVSSVDDLRSIAGHDAVVVGGALYAMRWHRGARRFVKRNAKSLRGSPVWLFSSGPLDDSASARRDPSGPPSAQAHRSCRRAWTQDLRRPAAPRCEGVPRERDGEEERR